MASIARSPRWTKDNPVWLIQYRDPGDLKRTRKLDGCYTEKDARKKLREIENRLDKGLFGMPQDQPVVEVPGEQLVISSIEGWSHKLTNRAKVSDGQQARKHLVTSKALAVPLSAFGIPAVKAFVLELENGKLGGGSQRRLFTLLARWGSWAVGEELIGSNPCRDLPPPVYERTDPTTRPWVKTEAELAALQAALPPGLRLPLWLGYRSGLRLGETFGLRLSDLEDVDRGYIRVVEQAHLA